MTKTENYQLNQWEAGDAVHRADFNADNAKIDAAIAENAKALTDYKTANDAAVEALEESVGGRLDSVNDALAALSANVGTAGRTARIAWGSYVGDKTYGSANPTSLTFDFYPVAVMVICARYAEKCGPCIMLRACPAAFSNCTGASGETVTVAWSDNGVSWYSVINGEEQNNGAYTYYYVVIGYDMNAETAE